MPYYCVNFIRFRKISDEEIETEKEINVKIESGKDTETRGRMKEQNQSSVSWTRIGRVPYK